MVKLIIQTISQVEVDTDTGKQRLLKGFTKLLGTGNGAKKTSKQVQLKTPEVVKEEW